MSEKKAINQNLHPFLLFIHNSQRPEVYWYTPEGPDKVPTVTTHSISEDEVMEVVKKVG